MEKLEQFLSTIKDQRFVETVKKSIQNLPKRFFVCRRCNRKFQIANARPNKPYQCKNCRVILSEIPEESIKAVNAEEVEVVISEAFPDYVQKAISEGAEIFGRFVLLEELGEGGMGKVYKAYDLELLRPVALKFIKSERVEELKAEARTLAGLQHRNIAQIFDIGSEGGKGFIAMEYIEGWRPVKCDTNVALSIMLDVCSAVEYAHRKGVIHRDIKPANIMIGKEDNRVFVLDFGLAVKGEAISEIAGTPGYMTPEIAEGKPATVLSDIYSLGATLYELLSGKRPIEIKEKEDFKTILLKCRRGIDRDIKEVAPGISNEVASIVRKATAIEPSKRYRTVQELADDIKRYQMGYPVYAYSRSAIYKIGKYVKRNKKVVIAVMAAMVSLIGAGYYGWVAFVAKGEQKRAEEKATELHTVVLGNLRREASEKTEMVLSLRRLGQNEKMREFRSSLDAVYEEVKKQGGRFAEAEYLMGRFNRALMEFEKAEEFIDRALEIDAEYGPALYEKVVLTATRYIKEFGIVKSRLESEEFMKVAREKGVTAEAAKEAKRVSVKEIEEAEPRLMEMRERMETAAKKLIELHKRGKRWKPEVSEGQMESAIGLQLAYIGKAQDDKNKMKEAEKILKEALKKDALLEEVYEALGRIKMIEGKLDEAIKIYTDGISVDRGYEQFYISRGEVQTGRGLYLAARGKDPAEDFKKAENDFTKAIDLNKDYYESWLWRGIVRNLRSKYLADQGKDPIEEFNKAEEDFTKAIELNKNYYGTWMGRGGVLSDRGLYLASQGKDPLEDYNKAEEDYTKAIELNKDYYESWVSRGLVRNNRGVYLETQGINPMEDYKKAEEDLTQAIVLKNDIFESWLIRGWVRINRGVYLAKQGRDPLYDYKKAEEDFTQAIELCKNYYESWLGRGLVRNNRGMYLETQGENPLEDYKKAEEDFTKAIGLNKNYYKSWLGRGTVRSNRGLYLKRLV